MPRTAAIPSLLADAESDFSRKKRRAAAEALVPSAAADLHDACELLGEARRALGQLTPAEVRTVDQLRFNRDVAAIVRGSAGGPKLFNAADIALQRGCDEIALAIADAKHGEPLHAALVLLLADPTILA